MASSAKAPPESTGPRRCLRIGMVAGEASGDILGSQLISALRSHCDELVVEGIGGPRMQAQGMVSLFSMEHLAVMGIVEPLRRLPQLLRMRAALYRHFRDDPPDLFLGIDAPDFNLRLEQKIRQCGITTCHLVSPSVWAWRRGRISKIRRAVDMVLCLFPFETDIYRQHGITARFVGHPLAEEVAGPNDRAAARGGLGVAPSGPLLALLPGSRAGEVRLLAPLFLETSRRLLRENPAMGFVIPAANEERRRELQQILARFPDLPVTLVAGQSAQVLAAADLALVASGTATLEAALRGCPMVVAYRMAALSWWLVSRMVRTDYAALPNILAGKALVPEFLQDAATPDSLAGALRVLLQDTRAADQQRVAFAALQRQLRGDFGNTTARALLELVASGEREPCGRSV